MKCFATLVIFVLAGCRESPPQPTRTAKEPPTPEPQLHDVVQEPRQNVPQNWDYSQEKDELDGTDRYYAVTKSLNTVQLPFPYDGAQRLTLTLRYRGSDGLQTYVRIPRGQIHYEDSRTSLGMGAPSWVELSFDNRAPVRMLCSPPTDHTPNVMFISEPARLLKDIKKARRMVIRLTFFQAGTHDFIFDISGLKSSF